MMSKYFNEIIIPPLPKDSRMCKFDENFWVEYSRNNVLGNLMTMCPTCGNVFILAHSIYGEKMQGVIMERLDEYVKYVKERCPKCFPKSGIYYNDYLMILVRKT